MGCDEVVKTIKELSERHQFVPYVMLCNALNNPPEIRDILNDLVKQKRIMVRRGLNDKLIKLI